MYDALGEPPRAFEHFNQALSLHRAEGDKSGEAVTLNNIGMLYVDLGEKQKANHYLTQALELYRGVGRSSEVAAMLGNLALVYFQQGEEQKGLDYANQALKLCKESGDKAGEGRQLSNIGQMYLHMGDRQKSTDYLTRALPLRKSAGDKNGEAATLYGLSILAYASNEHQKSLEYLHRAALLERAAGDRGGEAGSLSGMAEVWKAQKNRRLAVFFSKQAVAGFQELRGAMRGIDRASQQSFLQNVQSPFRLLTSLLLEDGRLAEAHQVLNIFKDQEFYDAIRPNSPGAVQARRLDLTPRERAAAEAYQAATERVASANRPLLDLEFKLKNRKPTAEEERQLRQLRARFEAANKDAHAALKQIEASFAGPASDQDKLATTSDTAEMQATLRDLSRRTNSPTVTLYTLGAGSKFHVLLITQDKLTTAVTPFSATDFIGGIVGDRRAKRDGLWLLLQSPSYDPRPQARELYDIVFKPIENEIKLVESEARRQNPSATVTIMWSLDSYLRYIPTGVLYDGEHYLAERYRNVVFTRANKERMTRPVSSNWTGLGFGSTSPRTVKFFGEEKIYDALPGAEIELAALFGTPQGRGLMTGQTWLDERFTKEAFLAALKQRRPLVHLASHFTFEPGDEARSFLLLGSGEVMTLEEMKTLDGLFTGVDLLALSACNTGAQRFGAEGREVDGFAELAQRLGAGSVLATLWPVSDASTPELMVEFYRLRQERQGTTKAEALRQAQLSLLKGTAKTTPQPANGIKGPVQKKRGRADIFGLTEEPSYTPRFHPNPKAPYAHPYYWGAFVLMGNAL
jgi:CHAT domain-containing protein/Tfp pilus assembly protein PilF